MIDILLFVGSFIFFYLMFYYNIIRRMTKPKKKQKKDEYPTEIMFFIKKYNISVKKLKNKKFLHVFSLIVSLELATMVAIITQFRGPLRLIIGGIVTLIVVVITFSIFSYYLKKGDKKNV